MQQCILKQVHKLLCPLRVLSIVGNSKGNLDKTAGGIWNTDPGWAASVDEGLRP